MSNSLNEVNLIGNLTADPEIRETPNGHKVASFSVATSKKWKDAAWEVQEVSQFHNIVAWRWLADIAESYMQKWKKVFIKWELSTRSYDKEVWGETVKMYRTEIVANSIILLGSPAAKKQEEWNDFPDDDFEKERKRKEKAKQSADSEIAIEDIPF